MPDPVTPSGSGSTPAAPGNPPANLAPSDISLGAFFFVEALPDWSGRVSISLTSQKPFSAVMRHVATQLTCATAVSTTVGGAQQATISAAFLMPLLAWLRSPNPAPDLGPDGKPTDEAAQYNGPGWICELLVMSTFTDLPVVGGALIQYWFPLRNPPLDTSVTVATYSGCKFFDRNAIVGNEPPGAGPPGITNPPGSH